MSSVLGRQLREVAGEAPATLPADDLWTRGVRRHRARRAASVLVVGVLLAAVGGLGLQVADDLRGLPPAPIAPVPRTGHLPSTIHVPAPWSAGTSQAGELGPLAVLGSSDRKRPRGLLGMVAYEGMYGISAADGTARFLDLPTSMNPDLPGEVALNAVLSPDGRWVAYPRYGGALDDQGSNIQIGWGIYDAVTGAVRDLADPDAPMLDAASGLLGFSGDSRSLVTTSWPAGVTDPRQQRLVAWDVETGAVTVLEGPGQTWTPAVGSGPRGVVWSRGRTTYQVDPETGVRSTVRTEQDVVSASFAPTGNAFAYLGGRVGTDGVEQPWQLFTGASREQVVQVTGLSNVNGVLGWRDRDHVVVVTSLQDYAVVDVRDGSVERSTFGGSVNLNIPVLAADLWANPMVPGTRPPAARDPRTNERLVFLAAAGAVGVLVVVRRRRRA